MANLSTISKSDRRPCYVLRVAGLPVLYGTHLPFTFTTNDGFDLKRRAAISASDFQFGRRMDENTRVVEVSSLSVTLICNDEFDGDVYDPGRVFSRLGYIGSDAFTRLSSAASSVDTSLTVEDSSGFSVDDYIHIGQETLKVASVVDATTLSVVRGVLGTIPRIHRVDEATGSFPYVTKPLSYFRGRRVILYEGRVGEEGSVSSSINDYVEIFRGFFSTEPALATAGRAMNAVLEIAPLTALFDKPLSSRTKTAKLHPRLHAFDGLNANEFLLVAYAGRGGLFSGLQYTYNLEVISRSGALVVEVTISSYNSTTRIATIGSYQQGNQDHLLLMVGGTIESGGTQYLIEAVDYFSNSIRLALPAVGYSTGSGQRMRAFDPQSDSSFMTLKSEKFESIGTNFYVGSGDFHPRKFAFVVGNGDREDGRVAFVRNTLSTNSQHIPVNAAHMYPTRARQNVTNFGNMILGSLENILGPFSLDTSSSLMDSARYVESKVIRMTTTGTNTSPDVKEWPAVLETGIMDTVGNAAANTVDGFFCKVMLDPTTQNILISSNLGPRLGLRPSKLSLAFSDDQVRTMEFVREQVGRVPKFEEIVGTTATTESATGAVLETREVSGLRRRNLPREAFEVSGEDAVTQVVLEADAGDPIADAVEVETKVASAFYYLGSHSENQGEVLNPLGRIAEAFIMLDGSLSLGSGGGYFEAVRGDDVLAILYLEDETEVTVNSITGFRYKVSRLNKIEPINSLVDSPGEERIIFRPTIVPSGSTIGEIILKLLCSTDGEGESSTAFDRFKIGCGLSDSTGHNNDGFGSDLEVNSFLGIPNPVNSETFSLSYKEGDTVLQTLEGILASVNYTIDIRTDSVGRCRLTAVEMGLPNSDMVVANLTTTEIADSPTPISGSEISIKNVFKFKANHDFKGEPEVEITVRDQVSIDLFNEASELDIDMKGVRINASSPGDAVAELRPVFQRLRIENSYPRRLFSFDVVVSSLLGLSLGDTVTVTHPQVRGVSGLGVSGVLARVRSIEYDGYSPTGSIEAIAYGVAGSVWSRTAEIKTASVSSGETSFVVELQDHSPSTNPLTNESVSDSSGFAVGDKVDVFDAASFDSAAAVEVTISEIPSPNMIKIAAGVTLTGAFGGPLGFIVSHNNPGKYAEIGEATLT